MVTTDRTAHTAVTAVRWSVVLVGGFALERDGDAVRLPLSAQRVLAFLALHGRPARRTYVAGNLWLDQPEEQAAGSLRTALWRIRKECDDLVDAGRDQLEIGVETEVDVRTARRLAQHLAAHEASPGPDATPLLRDLLPDWDDEWVVLERERFRQVRLHALEALCRELTGLRDFAAAVEAGVAAVDGEPLRESAHRVLIEAHLAEHNAGEAVRQYVRYRDLLEAELGVAPSADLDALMRAHGLTPR